MADIANYEISIEILKKTGDEISFSVLSDNIHIFILEDYKPYTPFLFMYKKTKPFLSLDNQYYQLDYEMIGSKISYDKITKLYELKSQLSLIVMDKSIDEYLRHRLDHHMAKSDDDIFSKIFQSNLCPTNRNSLFIALIGANMQNKIQTHKGIQITYFNEDKDVMTNYYDCIIKLCDTISLFSISTEIVDNLIILNPAIKFMLSVRAETGLIDEKLTLSSPNSPYSGNTNNIPQQNLQSDIKSMVIFKQNSDLIDLFTDIINVPYKYRYAMRLHLQWRCAIDVSQFIHSTEFTELKKQLISSKYIKFDQFMQDITSIKYTNTLLNANYLGKTYSCKFIFHIGSTQVHLGAGAKIIRICLPEDRPTFMMIAPQ